MEGDHFVAKNINAIYAEGAREFARQLIARDFTDEELADAVGALDDATLKVIKKTGAEEIRIEIEHSWIKEQHRWMRRDLSGHLLIFNYKFYKQLGAPRGIAIDSFQRQVAGARALGVKRIETFGAGDCLSASQPNGEIGYLVWAKFGFDAPLPEKYRRQAARNPALVGVNTLNELMARPGGEKWWHDFGAGLKMVFDLSPGSSMMDVFRNYLRRKGRLV